MIIGPESSADAFFNEAQKLGAFEFIRKKKGGEKPFEVETYIQALHVLRRMPTVSQAPFDNDFRSTIVLARHIVERNEELERVREERRILEKEIARVEVFGDFSVSDIHELEHESKRHFQFFFARSKEQLPVPEDLIWVGSSLGLDYYISIAKEKIIHPGFIEMKIERSVNEVREELADVLRKIDELETELARLAHQKKYLHEGLVGALNRYHLEDSKERTQKILDGEMFAVLAWIPKNKIHLLEELSHKMPIYFERIADEEGDRKPTYLENKGFGKLGEDLIGIYDVPSIQDRDPSLWVFIAFGLFFSMIIGDAGYGVLLLAISLFLFWKFKPKKGMGRRLLMLSTSLSIGCIIWGVLAASYLGIPIAPDSPLRKVSVIDWAAEKKAEFLMHEKNEAYKDVVKQYPEVENASTPHTFLMAGKKGDSFPIHEEFIDNVFMELVILIGTIHIMLSLLRYVDKNYSSIGWILFLIGGYLYFPSMLKATSMIHYLFGIPAVAGAHLGAYLIFIGIGLATLLAVIQKKWAGLVEPMQVISVFADVMSYLRIYALALAGMIMGSTFDKIGTSMPLYFGIFILLAGHTVNFTLALMGGVIHGLRLNFIEWYHYSFEGGGKKFDPLAILKME